MSRSIQILKALEAPRFVYRYSRKRSTIPDLQKKLECKVLAEKYSSYLSNYNTFALFQWLPSNYSNFDGNHFWKEFAQDMSLFNKNAIFLQDKLHNEAMNNCLKSKLLPASAEREYRCVFQTVFKPHSIESVLQLTTDPSAKLQLCALGLRTDGNSIAAYIQSLLEESEDMYKDISYEKLLSIAKRSRSDKDRPTKELLDNLAEKGLTNSYLVGEDQWLILSK